MLVRNAGVSPSDQAKVQNLIYFSEQDKQRQKQPTLSTDVDQLVNTFAGQQPQQQVPPPAGLQPQEVAPLQPANALTGTERMDTDVQDKETDQ